MNIKEYLTPYVDEVKKLYGGELSKIILFGSYARGDYTKNSDVDIMVLLKVPREDIPKKRNDLYDIGFDYLVKDDIEINVLSENAEFFEKLAPSYPFYGNVKKEGISLWG